MSYMNSITYIQRQIDKILRYILNVKTYIDDIITSARIF